MSGLVFQSDRTVMARRNPLPIAAPWLDSEQMLFTTKEACAILGIRSSKADALVRNGELTRVHMGLRCSRITKASVIALLERLGAAAAKTAAEPAPVKRGPGRPRKAVVVEQAAAQ